MTANPSDPAFVVQELYDRLRALETVAAAAAGRRLVYVEDATVSAAPGGATCTVTYDYGAQRAVRYLLSYTPVVGHRVLILTGGDGVGTILGRISA